jgi:hypothetical protein
MLAYMHARALQELQGALLLPVHSSAPHTRSSTPPPLQALEVILGTLQCVPSPLRVQSSTFLPQVVANPPKCLSPLYNCVAVTVTHTKHTHTHTHNTRTHNSCNIGSNYIKGKSVLENVLLLCVCASVHTDRCSCVYRLSVHKRPVCMPSVSLCVRRNVAHSCVSTRLRSVQRSGTHARHLPPPATR